MIKHIIALQAAAISLGYVLYILYQTVDADGSWYNKLYTEKGRKNVTFTDKLKYTLTHDKRKISAVKTTTFAITLPLAAYTATRILIAGILNF